MISACLQWRTTEPHCDFIRAVLCPRVAYLIGVTRIATSHTDEVLIGPVVGHRRNHYPITVDVDIGRIRSAPGEIHCVPALYPAPRGRQRDHTRGRSWRSCRCRCRCRTWSRCRRWARCPLRGRSLYLDCDWGACLEETDRRIGSPRRLVGIEPEIIQGTPADRIRVRIFRKGFRAPG